jgi:ABC-type sugar transport system ATPase subunit
MRPAIPVDRLPKRYGKRVALPQLSFTVASGEIVGLLGPNGAGKSTTVSILGTLLRLDAGTEAAAARRVLGLVPQQVALYPALRATENLHFFVRAQGLAACDAPAAVDHALDFDRPRRPLTARLLLFAGQARSAKAIAIVTVTTVMLSLSQPLEPRYGSKEHDKTLVLAFHQHHASQAN